METPKVVLDTDILVGLLRDVKDIVRFVKRLEEEGIPLATTIINIFELFYGAYKSKKREKNLKEVKDLADNMEVLYLDIKSSKIAGEILAMLESKGMPIEVGDVLIAAITLANDCVLATMNVDHFSRIKKLRIITPTIHSSSSTSEFTFT